MDSCRKTGNETTKQERMFNKVDRHIKYHLEAKTN